MMVHPIDRFLYIKKKSILWLLQTHIENKLDYKLMLFENIVIQEKIKSFFNQVIQNNRLAHAYLFHGKAGSGKTAFALELAKALNCQSPEKIPCNICPACAKIKNAGHPDIKFIFPLSKTIKEEKLADIIKQKTQNPYKKIALSGHLNIPIESIRDLKKEAMYAPYEAKKRVFIISGIEFLSREAANSFLKLLEEPPANLLIILITNDLSSVLDTIRSRCQPVLFPTFTDEQVKKIVEPYNENHIDLTSLIRINQNNVEKILDLLEQKVDDLRPQIVSFLRASAIANWPDINDITEKIIQTRDKNIALEFINLMMLWLTDAYRFNFIHDAEQLSNFDMRETISKFAGHYTEIDYSILIEKLEQTYKDIKGNGNVGLALYNLSIEIKRILSLKKSA